MVILTHVSDDDEVGDGLSMKDCSVGITPWNCLCCARPEAIDRESGV